MWLLTVIVFAIVSMCLQAFGESVDELSLGVLMKELQDEMRELRRIRQQDSEAIHKLQEEVYKYVKKDVGRIPQEEKKSIKDLSDRSEEDSQKNLEAMINEQKSLSGSKLHHFIHQFPNFKTDKIDAKQEANFLKQELLRLSKEMAEMKVHLSSGVSMSSGRVAVRWLQNTVEGLRREMKEMAMSLNTSATLAEKQRTLATLTLLKSDVRSMEHRMDGVKVDWERNAALIQQLRRDVDELRLRTQESAAGQQRILVEVDSLKEELREHILLSKKKDTVFNHHSLKKDTDVHKTGEGDHHRFRHGQWKAEIENLHDSVVNLEFLQTEISEKMRNLQKTQAMSDFKLVSLENSYNDIINNSEPFDIERRILEQRLDVLESLMNKTEVQTLDIQSKVNNITSTGIHKLHGSTMQLFSALERLERNYDRTTEDIRKEISKLDYNFSQTQSDLGELSDRQISSEQVASNLKNDITNIESDLQSNHLRLLLVQNAVLNTTFQPNQQIAQDSRISDLESKIQLLSENVDAEKLEIEVLHRQIVEKVDDKDFNKWERAQHKVRESILQFKEDIPLIKHQQEEMEEELEKFIHQLPRDCSGNSTLEQLFERQSGTYLIRSPIDELKDSAVQVFCDMDSSGGEWTLIQRRSKGDESFDKDWAHYKKGFGDIDGDFWIGNEILHKLTTSEKYVLRIDMWDAIGTYKYVEYNTFEVLAEMDNYRLVIAGYSGNASDALSYHNGMAFSTPDKDNDASKATHCAQFYGSGWWYNHCQYVNINGRYNTGITWYDMDGQEWSELMKVEMKIKPRTLFKS
ncbi:protein scabrous [Parasteatoda tepidariorum]|nr:protein scabrous [Parasteatoda tepidariorum]